MSTDTTDIHAAIRAAYDAFESTFARADAAGMAALYTSDGMLLPTGTGMISGSEAIQDFWQGAMDMGVATAKIDIAEVSEHADVVVDVGHYVLGAVNGDVLDNGKYIVIWRNENGRWKLHRDIWNSNTADAG